MDATEKSVCITQPSCEDLKILQGQIVKERKAIIIKTYLRNRMLKQEVDLDNFV